MFPSKFLHFAWVQGDQSCLTWRTVARINPVAKIILLFLFYDLFYNIFEFGGIRMPPFVRMPPISFLLTGLSYA